MLSRHLRNHFIGLVVVSATALFAVPALAQDRCEGTLCDLYYSNKPAPPPAPAAQPAGAQPLTVPNRSSLFGNLFGGSSQQQQPAGGTAAAPSARQPMVGVQGGGLIGMMQGAPQDRCEGTLCDLYYGGPKPERPEPVPQRAATGVAASPEDAADYAPQTAEPREVERPVERHCAGTSDPWGCYRK